MDLLSGLLVTLRWKKDKPGCRQEQYDDRRLSVPSPESCLEELRGKQLDGICSAGLAPSFAAIKSRPDPPGLR